jgi:beta-glucanase (GH16 family)
MWKRASRLRLLVSVSDVRRRSMGKKQTVDTCNQTPEGVWFAFWLLPKQPFTWPGDGEVDICEAWDGIKENGTCLHWGHFNGQDWKKHRVLKVPVKTKTSPEYRYGFAWNCASKKLLWLTDGQPTMKASIPEGIRSMKDFQIIINVAMGGNVMQGSIPQVPSTHDMVISDLKLYKTVPGGWNGFPKMWNSAREGNTM